jgi:monoamine oxidase
MAAGLDLRLGSAVTAVEHDGEGVTCLTAAGERLAASALVLALPINCLPAIAFTPALPARLAEAGGANAGAAVKLLMLARGVAAHGIAAGVGPGLNWLYADSEHDGSVLVTGFGWQDERFDPADGSAVERALRAFYPGAELVDWAHHDWIGDAASRGTWLTAPAGRLELVDPDRFAPLGRIVFAGSDVAHEQAGWFEGALRSGAAAATAVRALLNRHP